MSEEQETHHEAAPAVEKAAEQAEKARRKRRNDAQLIGDGIMEIKRRFDALAQEMVDGSLEAALDRGEVVTAHECQRRVNAAKAEVRAELRRLLSEADGK